MFPLGSKKIDGRNEHFFKGQFFFLLRNKIAPADKDLWLLPVTYWLVNDRKDKKSLILLAQRSLEQYHPREFHSPPQSSIVPSDGKVMTRNAKLFHHFPPSAPISIFSFYFQSRTCNYIPLCRSVRPSVHSSVCLLSFLKSKSSLVILGHFKSFLVILGRL